MNLNFGWLQLYAEALGDVLWGDLWLTPRGFAYLALLIGAGVLLASRRAVRVYRRHDEQRHAAVLAMEPRAQAEVADAIAGKTADAKLAAMLRRDMLNKFLAQLACAAVFFGMLSAQAYQLSTATVQFNNCAYWPGGTFVECWPSLVQGGLAYENIAFWFGIAALATVAGWVWMHVTGGDFDQPFKVRAVQWLADLVDPIQPGAPTNRVQRLVERLNLRVQLRNKMNV